MLFSSNVFLFFFLPVALLGYEVLGRFGRRAVFGWLSLVSIFFYAYWNPKFLLLLGGSILLNFTASRAIARVASERAKSEALIAAVVGNLALLFWFKYLFPLLHFFHGMGWLGRNFGSVVLPLGISFFTFTQIAYLVDLRQGEAEPQSFLSYTLFVTFFPHLIAGPIIHHSEMMPQFKAQRHSGLRADDMAVGMTWFVLGLSKKVLIADTFGPIADRLYYDPHRFGTQATWVGMLAYAIQLYFDFSGYSDMALGLARMFSITFPVNFNSPYKAANIIEFWQRWHMTLTRYLNLYLFNPIALAMSRRRIRQGKKATRKAQRTLEGFTQLIAFPMVATMFLAGVWHGAGMQFILFGLAHAVYLTANHAWRVFVPADSKLQKLLPLPVCVAITFACALAGQIFFRAQSARDAFYVFGTLMGLHHGGGLDGYAGVPSRSNFSLHGTHVWPAILAMLVICWTLPNTQEILNQVEESERTRSVGMSLLRWRPTAVWTCAVLLLTAAALSYMYASTSFLYFQF
jgi:D-alanyl-lipoteichoic acid acyltransferase DltB (MBOAT superfamily)